MSYFGMWGVGDNTVPPLTGANDTNITIPNRTCQPNGWYYTDCNYVTQSWATALNCDARKEVTPPNTYLLECWTFENCDQGTQVSGCIFDGHHNCNKAGMNDVLLDFMQAHPRQAPAQMPNPNAASLE
jgi:hypothetical protein